MAVAGIGYDAHVVYKLSLQMKLSWGVAGYIVEALRQAFRYPFPGLFLPHGRWAGPYRHLRRGPASTQLRGMASPYP